MRAIRPAPRRSGINFQRGVMLLEALIAILIFSVGVLGLVGLQATAIKQSGDAQYRADAAQLADRLIGQMWATNRSVGNLQASFASCNTCAEYQNWLATVADTLPGVRGVDTMKPSVAIDGSGIVTITIFWRTPGEDAAARAHRYDVETQIGP